MSDVNYVHGKNCRIGIRAHFNTPLLIIVHCNVCKLKWAEHTVLSVRHTQKHQKLKNIGKIAFLYFDKY